MFPKSVRRFLVAGILAAAVYFFVIQPRNRHLEIPPAQHERRESRRDDRPEHRRPETTIEPGPNDRGSNPSGQVICETKYFADWIEPLRNSCAVHMRNRYPIPDARCTPGGVNPSVTPDVLRDRSWRTRTVRNCATSEAQKHAAYLWYEIEKPRLNSNQNQVCELDHLVPLELGGADGLGNIWPQCGPDAVTLNERYFKKKDHVENYLAEEVKDGRMPLDLAQKGIALDWTQYLDQAENWCTARGRC